jgi:flagellar biosynthetic protein FlhB
MAFDDGQTRTEAATPRRQEKARQQGRVAFSADLTSGLLLLAGALILWLGGQSLGETLLGMLRTSLIQAGRTEWGPTQTAALSQTVAAQGLHLTGLLLGLLFLTGFAVSAVQAGFHVSTDPLAIDWGKLSVARGWARLLSSQTVVRTSTAVLKVALLAAIVVWVLKKQSAHMVLAGRGTLAQAADHAWQVTILLALTMAVVLVLIGLLDYLLQRWRFARDLMMSRRDLLDEHREEEGDPQIRARIKKLQRELGEGRMIQHTREATVVLTNPTHVAVALRYERGEMDAPRVVAKGAGLTAKRIVRIAEEHGIPVLERKPLARALYASVEVGQEIPAEFYQAIAEILAHVYHLRRAA